MNKEWIKSNTFHYSDFSDLGKLVDIKREKKLKISLCLPTLNEEKTIAKEIVIIKSELMSRFPLVDEIAVIDSGSTDNTKEIVENYGADFYSANDILPKHEKYMGKGENLWKALYILNGDIIVYIDADIKNIHHRFVYGLLGPIIMNDTIKYVKGFYDRPLALDSSKIKPSGGGRVTELVIRPLFSIFFPELTQILQPLSGEYAGTRDLLEKIPFPIGYGIETSMILDIYKKWGMSVIGQVDLEKRVHRNQDTKALGRMAFGIMQTFFNRLKKLELMDLKSEIFNTMIQWNLIDNKYERELYELSHKERPPIITVPEYIEKYRL